MPSPFPGMDPYLEGSEWTSVHVELSSAIARQLAPKLRPKYIVRTMRRLYSPARAAPRGKNRRTTRRNPKTPRSMKLPRLHPHQTTDTTRLSATLYSISKLYLYLYLYSRRSTLSPQCPC
jgi:hypothetical protein